ncbi:hypothetical protein J2847_006786 [Azospirillum agricola]|nr:hypothetical protein [Azospirillum agricola]
MMENQHTKLINHLECLFKALDLILTIMRLWR